jgi:putative membrane protein
MPEQNNTKRNAWVVIFLAVLVWSGIGPHDYLTWFLEVAPAIIGGDVLWMICDLFRLTALAYGLILAHCIILMVGGHYTYTEVRLFDWIGKMFDHERNNYEKVGHFAQGYIPAIVAREIVIRKNVLHGVAWRNFFIVCFCLGFSALYELIECWVALLSGEGAEEFLGTQGYVWDTQSDMGWALFGAVTALILLNKIHHRQLADIDGS